MDYMIRPLDKDYDDIFMSRLGRPPALPESWEVVLFQPLWRRLIGAKMRVQAGGHSSESSSVSGRSIHGCS